MRMRKTLAAGLTIAASVAAMFVAPAAYAGYPFPYQCQYSKYNSDWVFSGGFGTASGETICVNDTYELATQTDGNFVLYNRNASPIWASGTWNHSGATATFQTDGNLVVYAPNGGPALWASGTYGNPGSTFAFQQDGNLVIYGSSHQVLWASGTNGR
ncbi:hypothetical protein [Streptomyces broussonetiae]|uniref:Bulb-type lectin domain-containing protein n=1 Tax=Streptomyces broussonetiae TaxID=2686304 RepID=A0A6I6MZC3_9ACTN|nr:hypothetical protein [Streptomyces broussonetiae]QHA02407.1 hypothetical protein GQF42_03065 [Streptomyces broussonetiae]